MPPKRPAADSDDDVPATGREKKKLKVAYARTIPVQNAEAGPSRTNDSMKGLPSAIDVEKFTEARSFEIDAMHTAMKTASASSTKRAWQALPRQLRRRAASHDPRRVPKRLREKAHAEIDPVQKKASSRTKPKRGANQPNRTETLLKRQKDKTWLESHLWHAKRMIMENIWGYRLSIRPTEKAFRPSHRASVHGSILHDASYFALIELKGEQSIVRKTLEYCCDPQGTGPGAARFLDGSRAFESHVHAAGAYPLDLISPVIVMWRPKPPVVAEISSRGNGPEVESAPVSTDPVRTVWVRCHPAVFGEVYETLQRSASVSLAAAAKAHPAKTFDVELADLREQVNVFEIMGPKSNQVIKGALKPVSAEKRIEFNKFWTALRDLGCSGSLPRGMIVGFKVNDPRLTFPPKNAQPLGINDRDYQTPPENQFHNPSLAESSVWDADARDLLKKPRYKKKDIDDRKGKNLIPGTPLNAMRQDDRIPIILIQRSLESTGLRDSQGIHGWTLVVPAGWSMPFFSSLTFTGTRVGGLRECATQSFEAGALHFPRDYVSTPTFEETARVMGAEEKRRWERKPPAKRPNYENLESPTPWISDWNVALGIPSSAANLEEEEGFTTTQREMRVDPPRTARPWLLRGSAVETISASLASMLDPIPGLLTEMNKFRIRRGLEILPAQVSAKDLWKGALVSVRIVMVHRGVPDDRAFIYKMDDEEAKAAVLNAQIEPENGSDVQDTLAIPPSSSIIGYVTSGNFSLSRGKTFALGAVSLDHYIQLYNQAKRLSTGTKGVKLLAKTRNQDGTMCRTAYLDILP